MEIRILIRSTEPLTGTAMAEGEKPLDFQGWLELLNALSTLTGEGEVPGGRGAESLARPGTHDSIPTP